MGSRVAIHVDVKVYIGVLLHFIAILVSASAFAEVPTFSFEAGNYVSDVKKENADVGTPLVLIPIPDVVLNRKSIHEQIFDQNLTREFDRRYEDTFGRTQAEITYRERGRIDYVQGVNGELVSVRQNSDKEHEFGTFMFRRMAEYHFENYSKTQENLKQVQDVKEKVTNYEVSVAPGYSFKSNYSISGNYIDINILNPLIGSRARLEMDPGQIGPTQIREARVALDRGLTRTVSIEAHYTVYDGIASLITRKTLTATSSLSLSGSTYLKTIGASTREHLGLLGYGMSF